MKRRKLLAAGISCGFASLSSGCIANGAPMKGTENCTPPVEEFTGKERQYKEETYSDIQLELENGSSSQGETISITLRNEGRSVIRTRGRDRFDIQAQDGSNWDSILCASDVGSKEVQLAPGDSFDWAFELSATELVVDIPALTANVDELRPGTYRFVYCGLAPAELAEDDSGFWTLIWRQFEITSG